MVVAEELEMLIKEQPDTEGVVVPGVYVAVLPTNPEVVLPDTEKLVPS